MESLVEKVEQLSSNVQKLLLEAKQLQKPSDGGTTAIESQGNLFLDVDKWYLEKIENYGIFFAVRRDLEKGGWRIVNDVQFADAVAILRRRLTIKDVVLPKDEEKETFYIYTEEDKTSQAFSGANPENRFQQEELEKSAHFKKKKLENRVFHFNTKLKYGQVGFVPNKDKKVHNVLKEHSKMKEASSFMWVERGQGPVRSRVGVNSCIICGFGPTNDVCSECKIPLCDTRCLDKHKCY